MEIGLKEALRQRLRSARALTDDIFSIVRPEALLDRPIPERHRILFYIGHLEAFDWNLLARDSLGLASFNPEFDQLFAFGIDPVDGGLPDDQPSDWPSIARVREYNNLVRRRIDACLDNATFDDESVPYYRSGWAFHIAVEHRLMHAETFGYMLHWLPYEEKYLRQERPELGMEPGHRMIEIPPGTVALGLDRNADPFLGWDNEYERHLVHVPAFAIDIHKVTNREYLNFVRIGGYRERIFWSQPDWEWIRSAGITHPRFWTRRGNDWCWRGMFQEHPLPLDWPVYVSHAEASAYARWAGKQLPTEAQYHRAAYGEPDDTERAYPWGGQAPGAKYGNFDFQRWNPVPVGSRPDGDSPFGVSGMLGNGWEWTSSIFTPFPGFTPLPFYPGYSANFFDGRHFVLKGASALTGASLLRRTFRNWFQPHYPYLYSAFRCVEN